MHELKMKQGKNKRSREHENEDRNDDLLSNISEVSTEPPDNNTSNR